MREQALEFRKEFIRLKDDWEELSHEERVAAEHIRKEYDGLMRKLDECDIQWIDTNFAEWYSRYLNIRTHLLIKPEEG